MKANELSRITIPSLPSANDIKIDTKGLIDVSSMRGVVRKYNEASLLLSKRDEDKERRLRAIEEKMVKIYGKKINPKYFGLDWRIIATDTPTLEAQHTDDDWETYDTYLLSPIAAFVGLNAGYLPYFNGVNFDDSHVTYTPARTTVNSLFTVTDTVTIDVCADAGVDTNQFLVRDAAGNIDHRTGAEVLVDLSGDAGAAFDWNNQSLNNINIATANSCRVVNDCSPTASDGATLGTAALEFSDLYLADGGIIYLGDDQDVTLTHIPDQSISLNLSLTLVSTTSAYTGVFYKGTDRFLHDFHHPVGGGAIPAGHNLFIGENSGNFTMGNAAVNNYEASYNVGIGIETLISNTLGYNNVGIGYKTLWTNSTGYSNVALGTNALYLNLDGFENTAFGYGTLRNNSGGDYNVGVGSQALYGNTGGGGNLGIGYKSVFTNTTGGSNVGVGSYALYSNLDADYNIGLGVYSLRYNVSGEYNIAIGYIAGMRISGGANNTDTDNSIFIGYDTRPNAVSETNQIVIGHSAIGLGSNTTVIGNSSTTTARIYGDIQIDSDTDMLILGDGQDAGIYYDGSDLVFDSQLVGAGDFYFKNGNVGIGISPSASYRLDVRNSSDSNLYLANFQNTNVGGTSHVANIIVNADGNNAVLRAYGDAHATYPNLSCVGTVAGSTDFAIITAGALPLIVKSTGNVGVATSSPLSKFDVSASKTSIFIGADTGSNTSRTDNTTKEGAIAAVQYDIDEEGTCIAYVNNAVGGNSLYIGGGLSERNAVTGISFYTAANTTTLTGTSRMLIDSSSIQMYLPLFLYSVKSGANQAAAGAAAGEVFYNTTVGALDLGT